MRTLQQIAVERVGIQRLARGHQIMNGNTVLGDWFGKSYVRVNKTDSEVPGFLASLKGYKLLCTRTLTQAENKNNYINH